MLNISHNQLNKTIDLSKYKSGKNLKDKVIYSFRYLRWSMYWKTIAVTALKQNYDDYPELMMRLRRFYYLYWIAGKTLTQIK